MNTGEIHDDLHFRLTTGHFEPGHKLRPSLLSERYGCSANTVREVLFRLAGAGLVEFEEQRGFRTPALSDERRRDLTKFRILLEQEGARASIDNGGIDWEGQLMAAHHRLAHIENRILSGHRVEDVVRAWSDAEFGFHLALISACDSPYLIRTFRTIYDQFRQQVVTPQRARGFREDNKAEHEAILEAAINRDAEACARAIANHLAVNLRVPWPEPEA